LENKQIISEGKKRVFVEINFYILIILIIPKYYYPQILFVRVKNKRNEKECSRLKKNSGVKWSSVLAVFIFVFLTGAILTGCGGTAQKAAETPSAQAPAENTQETLSDLFSKGQNIEGLSYDYIVTLDGKESYNGKINIQRKKMRSESTVEGQKTITIVDGDSILSYNSEQNIAYKITADMTDQVKTPAEYINDASAQTEKYQTLETAVYDGVKCRVISVTGADGQEQTKMWVREDYGIPLRVETKGADGSIIVIEYKNMKIGSLPDDIFKLPAGVKVMDMNEITNMLPQ
jgi:outer membrane lipoprotein-sorting protein